MEQEKAQTQPGIEAIFVKKKKLAQHTLLGGKMNFYLVVWLSGAIVYKRSPVWLWKIENQLKTRCQPIIFQTKFFEPHSSTPKGSSPSSVTSRIFQTKGPPSQNYPIANE